MLKILIVDDEPHIVLLLEEALEDLEENGVELLTAENGEEALKIIREEQPQLVFLDVMMPKMNGFDVCHQVKKELKLESVYIIMLTAKGQEFDKQRGESCGSDLYITKPFNPLEIVSKAREILSL
jgi:DNA-binding response OmpR family regulator